LFRTFSFILLTSIPLSPSYPFILLTHTFLYTFPFSLMITGKRTRNESIDWRRKSIVTVQAFTWLKGGPRLQCPLATAPTWAFYSNPVKISCNLSSVSSTSSRLSQTPGRFKSLNSSSECGYIVPRILSPSSAVNSSDRSNVHRYSVRPLARRRPPRMASVGRPYSRRIRTNGSGR
jgi:hypothetical protein